MKVEQQKCCLMVANSDEVEKYYKECEEAGTNEYQIDKSKTAMASMSTILPAILTA